MDKEVHIAGATTFWSLPERLNFATTKSLLENASRSFPELAGLLEKHPIRSKPPLLALKDAMHEVVGAMYPDSNHFIRPYAGRQLSDPQSQTTDEGYHLVRQDAEGFKILVSCYLPESDEVPPVLAHYAEGEYDTHLGFVGCVRTAYAKHLGLIGPSWISTMLVSAQAVCDGIKLRPTGGVYYIPPHGLALWNRFRDCLSVDTAVRIFIVNARKDVDALEAVQHSLEKNILVRANEITQVLSDPNLPVSTVERLHRELRTLLEKTRRYEKLLEKPLPSVVAAIENASTGVAYSSLILAALA